MKFLDKLALPFILLSLAVFSPTAPTVQAQDGMTRVYFVNDTPVPLTFHVQGRGRFTCRTTQAVPRCNLLTPSGYRTLVATFDDGEVALTQSFDLPPDEPFLWTVRPK